MVKFGLLALSSRLSQTYLDYNRAAYRQYTLLVVRSGGRGLGNLFTAVVNRVAPSRIYYTAKFYHFKAFKAKFPVIIISQIEYADEIEIPCWVPQFNENWRH